MGTEVDVLQVITSTAPRGAEQFAVSLQPELEQRGLSVRTVALVAAEHSGLDVAVLGTSRLGPSTLRALRQEVRQASVVAAHGSSTLPAAFLATAGGTIRPYVYRNIGDPVYWSTSRSRRLRSRLFLSRAVAVAALTDETARRITRYYAVPPERITSIPRGVSTDEFPLRTESDRLVARQRWSVDPSARLAVSIGALSPEKDIPTAVRAVGLLPDPWQLLIAGDGPDRGLVDETIRQVGGDRVRRVGIVSDPASLLAAADVLLLPSLTEGLPGVVIEAAMTGVASVVTDVGFVRELIEPGISGMIVPSENPEAMAAAVLEAEPNLVSMGTGARRRVITDFSLAGCADRWYRLLAPLVADRSSSIRLTP